MLTTREFRDRLKRRAKRVGIGVPNAILAPLETYYRLLAQWNARINLTALPLEKPTDETFDRLLVEPLAAARHVPDERRTTNHSRRTANVHEAWFDLGSGGGSPAIPLKIMRPDLNLTMIESKARKAAFLREAIRTLELASASVQQARFEELEGQRFDGAARLVTVRALRATEDLFSAVARFLSSGGHLFLFHSSHRFPVPPSFTHIDTVQISDSPNPALLSRFVRL